MVFRPITAGALPRASTVLCLVCYAGRGQFYVNEEWESLPALFLKAGAHAVVSTTWPAWLERPTKDHTEYSKPHHFLALTSMMTSLSDKSCTDDAWEIPRVVTSWMSDQAKAEKPTDPRVWAGWSVWTA